MPLDRYTYSISLSDGSARRIASTREITHAVLMRTVDNWDVQWCEGRIAAYREQKRFMSHALHRLGLRPDQYESLIEPVVVSEAPRECWAVAHLPGRSKARHLFRPSWGEPPPIAVVATSDGDGWKATAWVATPEAQAREVKRLKKMHRQVMIAAAKQEVPR